MICGSNADDERWYSCMWETLVFTFPILKWFPELIANEDKWSLIKADVIAGVTVGVMAIPQSMSYVKIKL